MKKHWKDYLWIASVIYLTLGFFNILFAWIGMLCFCIPLLFAIIGSNKAYCNYYCGRGQLFEILGSKLNLSKKRKTPGWMKHKIFRYLFLLFFLTMFIIMIWNTYLVAANAKSFSQVVTLFWTINLPWHWAFHNEIRGFVAQFSFGFYSVMLTSTLLGLITMILYKPRSWCVYCPMGTMTQLICKTKNYNKE